MKNLAMVLCIGFLLTACSGSYQQKSLSESIPATGWLFELDIGGQESLFFVNAPRNMGVPTNRPSDKGDVWTQEDLTSFSRNTIVALPDVDPPSDVKQKAESSLSGCAKCAKTCSINEYIPRYTGVDVVEWNVVSTCTDGSHAGTWYILSKRGLFTTDDDCALCTGENVTIMGKKMSRWDLLLQARDKAKGMMQEYITTNNIQGTIKNSHYASYEVKN